MHKPYYLVTIIIHITSDKNGIIASHKMLLRNGFKNNNKFDFRFQIVVYFALPVKLDYAILIKRKYDNFLLLYFKTFYIFIY